VKNDELSYNLGDSLDRDHGSKSEMDSRTFLRRGPGLAGKIARWFGKGIFLEV